MNVVEGPAAGAGRAPVAADDAALWTAFTGATTAGEFCRTWLALQCGLVGDAVGGLLLLEDSAGRYAPAAIWPDGTRDLSGLADAAEQALRQRRGIVLPRPAGATDLAYPVEVAGRLFGVVAIELPSRSGADLVAVQNQLLWGAGWIEALFRRRHDETETALRERRGLALQVLAVASEHRALKAAAMAVATDLATSLRCQTVAIGLRRGKAPLRIVALSHSAWFERHAQIVDAIENAMEEMLDQARTVALPPAADAAAAVSLAHRDLVRLTASRAVASVALVAAGREIGAITLLREADGDTFPAEVLATVETIGVLLGPLFEAKDDADRPIAGRYVRAARESTTKLLGPDRPALKLATLAALISLGYAALATGPFRITARASLEGRAQLAAVVPFDGYVLTAPRRAGDRVRAGDVLATLDDRDLALEAIRWRSEREQQSIRYQDALSRQDRPVARLTAAMIAQTEAQIALVEGRIARAVIRAPFDGLVVSGDLSQQLGSPVERGRVLFEIAPVDAYRVSLQVDERDIALLREGAEGALVLASFATDRFGVRVTRITPVATIVDGRNVFRVEAELTTTDPRLRPGLDGVAKLDAGAASLLWIWTRLAVDWLRIAAWSWLP